MIIRPITHEEAVEANKIQTLAFLGKHDYSNQEDNLKRCERDWPNMRAAFDDSGKMTAVIEAIPYRVRYNGHEVGMCGIGGVASLPESRRQGAVRAIFADMFRESVEKGWMFSFLYPFSFAYYRQFGYELGFRRADMMLPMSALKTFPKEGRLEMLEKDADAAICRSLYTEFIRHRNLAVVRDDANWKDRLGRDAYNTNRYSYLYRDASGQPAGYVQWGIEDKDGKRNMFIGELIWTDGHLQGILGALYTWSAQFEKIRWRIMPDDFAIHQLFLDPYELDIRVESGGMNRVTDVKGALMLYPWQQGAATGRVILEVRDGMLGQNAGRWAVAWEDGEVSVKQVTDGAHLSLDVTHLSQLLTGAFSLEEVLMNPQVKIDGQKQLLMNLFPRRAVYMADYF